MSETIALVQNLFSLIAPYAGLAALVAFVVQLGKSNGVIKDGQAGLVSATLNLLAGAVVYFIKQSNSGFDFGSADAVLGEIASVGAALVALFGQVGGSKAFYLLGKWAGVFASKTETE